MLTAVKFKMSLAAVLVISYLSFSLSQPSSVDVAFLSGINVLIPEPSAGFVDCGAMLYGVEVINNDTTVLPNTTLTFTFIDTNNDVAPSLKGVSETWKNGSVAFVGPEDECVFSGRLAGALDLPMLGWKCSDTTVSDKTKYPTFIRTDPPNNSAAKSIIALMLHYGWSKFSILYSPHQNWATLADTLVTLSDQYNLTVLHKLNFTEPFVTQAQTVTHLLLNTYLDTRIYVMLGDKDFFHRLVKDMDRMGLSGTREYVVLGIYEWEYMEERHAYSVFTHTEVERNYFIYNNTIRLTVTPPNSPNYTAWEAQVLERRHWPPFNLRRLPAFLGTLQITRSARYLYDALHVYAKALDSLFRQGGSSTDGVGIFSRMINRTYTSVSGSTFYIDENGDAEANWTGISVQPYNGAWSRWGWGVMPMAKFYARGYTQLADYNETVAKWAGEDTPPDEPPCGFDGERCRPVPNYLPHIIGGTLGGIVLILAIVIFIIYRRYRFEQQLASLIWKIELEDIQQTKDVKAISQISLLASQASLGSFSAAKSQIFTRVGIYRGTGVALKRINKKGVVLTRSVRLELRQMRDMRHDHLCNFVGAVVDASNIIIVTEYCNKGSLQDLLENTDVKLDKMFKASLIFDLVKGMIYLHGSDIRTHGNLKSSNCLVDSRWVLKITDFGLHEFKKGQDKDRDSIDHQTFKDQLWTAPELLRDKRAPLAGTPKADVYSFGIILYEIEGRLGPYGSSMFSPKEIVERVRDGTSSGLVFRPDLSLVDTKDFIAGVMRDCWAEVVEDRPDFKICRTRLKPLQKGLKSNIFDNMIAIMERYANNLEEVVVERTEELNVEKEKTEALLHRMLPPSVANQLKMGIPVAPEWFDSVTIYFSDIVGFTALSAGSTPLQIVTLLNDLYTLFDSIVADYDVYKVETIGDAYMVVSGLPQRNGDLHAGEVASLSLKLLENIKSFTVRHKPDHLLRLRIGIHTGPCAAGVVGHTMPRYCLFGDTVNTASRMESNGEPLQIHVSPQCAQQLEQLGGYDLEARGFIAMKGKGEVYTYWLRSEVSEVRDQRYQAFLQRSSPATNTTLASTKAAVTRASRRSRSSRTAPPIFPEAQPAFEFAVTETCEVNQKEAICELPAEEENPVFSPLSPHLPPLSPQDKQTTPEVVSVQPLPPIKKTSSDSGTSSLTPPDPEGHRLASRAERLKKRLFTLPTVEPL